MPILFRPRTRPWSRKTETNSPSHHFWDFPLPLFRLSLVSWIRCKPRKPGSLRWPERNPEPRTKVRRRTVQPAATERDFSINSTLTRESKLRSVKQLLPGLELPAEYRADRKSTRLNSSHSQISYAVFCLKKKKKTSNDLCLC